MSTPKASLKEKRRTRNPTGYTTKVLLLLRIKHLTPCRKLRLSRGRRNREIRPRFEHLRPGGASQPWPRDSGIVWCGGGRRPPISCCRCTLLLQRRGRGGGSASHHHTTSPLSCSFGWELPRRKVIPTGIRGEVSSMLPSRTAYFHQELIVIDTMKKLNCGRFLPQMVSRNLLRTCSPIITQASHPFTSYYSWYKMVHFAFDGHLYALATFETIYCLW